MGFETELDMNCSVTEDDTVVFHIDDDGDVSIRSHDDHFDTEIVLSRADAEHLRDWLIWHLS